MKKQERKLWKYNFLNEKLLSFNKMTRKKTENKIEYKVLRHRKEMSKIYV